MELHKAIYKNIKKYSTYCQHNLQDPKENQEMESIKGTVLYILKANSSII